MEQVLVCYATQGGTAKEIAEFIHRELKRRNVNPILLSIDAIELVSFLPFLLAFYFPLFSLYFPFIINLFYLFIRNVMIGKIT